MIIIIQNGRINDRGGFYTGVNIHEKRNEKGALIYQDNEWITYEKSAHKGDKVTGRKVAQRKNAEVEDDGNVTSADVYEAEWDSDGVLVKSEEGTVVFVYNKKERSAF